MSSRAQPHRRKRTARFIEIAELAGVSPATVDRVLNERGSVSERARNRVISAARQLDVPRVLPLAQHGLIHFDVLLPDNATPFFRRLNVALQRSIAMLDRRIVVHRSLLPEHRNDVIANAILHPPYRRRGLIVAAPDTEPVRDAVRTITARGETAVAVVTSI
ncbi:MAG: LacI family DNA-binding transcriptional regulator, partial [Propionivibrio sp.]